MSSSRRIFWNPSIGLSILIALSNNAMGGDWVITKGKPETVLLDENPGVIRRLLDDKFGDGYWKVTVHEFTSSRPSTNPYKSTIETTGNSVTFRIPRRMVIGSSVRGPGDRKSIPISLWYLNGKLTDDFTGDKSVRYPAYNEQSIQLFIESAWEIIGPRPVRNPSIRGVADGDIERSVAAYSGTAEPSGIVYSGKKYCGYEVFSTYGFNIPNKVMREAQKPPLTYGDLLIARESNRITRKIQCVPLMTTPACHTTDYILGWVPIKISFSGENICQLNTLVDSVKIWTEEHVVSQTTKPNGNTKDKQ